MTIGPLAKKLYFYSKILYMKKFILSLILVPALFVSVLAQNSLQVDYYDTLVVGDATTTRDLYGIAIVKNVSSLPVEVAFKRIDRNYTALTDSNAICWGLCFTTDISVSPPAFNRILQPGESDTASMHVYPDGDGYTRTGDITYVFFDYFNPGVDTAAFTVSFKVEGQPIGLAEERSKAQMSVFPNPARNFINLNYQLGQAQSAQFELLNLAGAKVLTRTLNENNGQLRLSTENLPAGVYFYHLKINGKALVTKKLVIR